MRAHEASSELAEQRGERCRPPARLTATPGRSEWQLTASSSSNGLNYPVYHHFRWDHCAAAGVPFEYEGKKANAGENKGAGGDETRRRRVKVGGERGGRGGEGDDRLRDTKQE